MIVNNQLQGVGFSTTGDWEHDFIPNREELDAASDELDGRIKALNADVGTGGDVAFNVAWTKLQTDWDSWYDPFYWFFPRTRRDELMGFRARFNEMREWWSRLGTRPSSVAAYSETQIGDKKDAPDQWVSVAKWVAGGLIAIAGAVAIGHITGLVKVPLGLMRLKNPARWFYLPRSKRRGRRRRVVRGRRRRRVTRVRLPKPRRRGGRMTYPWKNAYGRYVYYTAENYPVKRKRRRR